MSSPIAIQAQNLTKTYKLYSQPIDRLKESLNPFKKQYHKNFNALDSVSFEIKKGEIVGIIGRNGSGKSTLLKVITSVLTPTSGNFYVDGHISAILELGAGFNGEMTGMENIYLNSTINGLSKEDIDKKVDEIVDFAELGEFIHQPIKTYSSGMRARLAFGVAIHVKPDIFIVDEALSVGDAAFQRKCFAKMEEIKKAGATILFVSHSEASIVSLCDRAIWIHKGKQVIDGSPKSVTGLYMKYMNDKDFDKQKIEKEYITLKQNIAKKDKKEVKKPKKKSIEEFYDPNLKPKSTIYYEEKGAKISDVKITTLEGEKVNVLLYNKKYLLTIKYSFTENFSNVLFGVNIRNTQGLQLSGIQFNKQHKIKIDKGDVEISFIFNAIYNNGHYYVTSGIKNQDNKKFIHRICDAYAFKIMNAPKNILGIFNSFTVQKFILNNNIKYLHKDLI